MHSLRLFSGLSVGLVAALVGCGGQALDVGSSQGKGGASGSSSGGASMVGNGTQPQSGGAGSGAVVSTPMAGSSSGAGAQSSQQPDPDPPPQRPWPSEADCSADASAMEGTWTGYVQGEGHAKDFTLVFSGGGDTPCGTFTVGEPQAFPPATDPEHDPFDLQMYYKLAELLPGFTYTILDAQITDQRLQFHVSYPEPYASWCALQTPYHDDRFGGYLCLPDYDTGYLVKGDRCIGTGPNNMELNYACDQVSMCVDSFDSERPCFCTADGCQANRDGSGARFDLHVEGDQASGLWDDYNVFLKKQ